MSTLRGLIADEINDLIVELAVGTDFSCCRLFTLGASLAVSAIRGAVLIRRLNKLRKLIDRSSVLNALKY